MPQMQLPIFPEGVTHITPELAFAKQDGRVTYFHGSLPVFVHEERDVRTFRMITSQFCVNGNATQMQVARAFGITPICIKRAVKLYREKGPEGFYAPRKTRGPAVLTEEILQKVQEKLDEGASIAEVAKAFSIKRNTLSKAVRAGHLRVSVKKKRRP
jgi:transposase-like protein